EEFTKEKGFDEYAKVFKKGTLLTQSPGSFERLLLLDEADQEAIRREKTYKWSQPKDLYMTIIICSLAAAVQGWDQMGSNGANLSFPTEFGIPTDDSAPNREHNEWIVRTINAGPYITCALLGCWLTDPLNNYLGCQGTIFFCRIFCMVTVCQLLLGLGMGPKASMTPIFAAENTPAAIQGGLVMSWQMWTTFGIFLGFCVNLILYQISPLAWRLQLGSAFLLAVPLVIGIYFCPTFKSFKQLRNTELQATRDFLLRSTSSSKEAHISCVIELFTIPCVHCATLASWVVMITQQMCGINIITFYSSMVFASFGFRLVNWLFAFPAVWVPLIALFIFIFAAFYSPGEGLMPFTYSAEVFLLTHHEMGMSWAVATCLGWVVVLSITFPCMLTALTEVGAFGFYAGLNVLMLIMIFFLLPETKQRTLEELDYGGTFLPYWIKKWVFWQQDAVLEPLYHLDEVESITVFEKAFTVCINGMKSFHDSSGGALQVQMYAVYQTSKSC
ncbi:hypothetical protein EDD18DRAFT_1176559, partial [Armillaria luteobubalina]